LFENAQLSKQPEWVHTEVKATKVPLRLATKVLADSISNQPPEAASLVWIVKLTCMVDPDTVIPFGAVVEGGEVGSPGSSELTQEVKNETPNVLMTVANPAFSMNFRLEAVRVPDLGN
jgi:hypothetical protein